MDEIDLNKMKKLKRKFMCKNKQRFLAFATIPQT